MRLGNTFTVIAAKNLFAHQIVSSRFLICFSSTCGRGMSANCRTRSGALSTEAGPMRSV